MSAIETERGVGECPERPDGLGHVWAGAQASGDDTNPCRFCGASGRAFFIEATGLRTASFAGVHSPMDSGSGKVRVLSEAQQAKVVEVVEGKRRRDAEAVAGGVARPGQAAGAPKGKAK